MSTPFSRSRLARLLGVTPGRVSQMQSSGEIVKPEIELDEKTNVWPATYGESIVARRSGRKVSSSVYGFLPPAKPAERSGDTLVQVRDYWCFGQKFSTPSGVIVLASLLSRSGEDSLPGMAPGNAREVYIGEREMVDLMQAVADDLLDGDVFAAAWAWWPEQSAWLPGLKEVVVIDDGTEGIHRPLLGRHDRGLRVETNQLSYQDLANKLGRPVPLFPSAIATVGVVELWQAAGRQRAIKIVVDSSGHEERAASASLIRVLPGLSDDEQELACRALLKTVDWDESGRINEDPWRFHVRGNSDVIDSLALPQQPNIERYRAAIGDSIRLDETADLTTIQNTMDRLSDLLETVYGPFGEKPDHRAAFAIRLARRYLLGESEMLRTEENAVIKRYRVIRNFEPHRTELWAEYRAGLKPLARESKATPATRELQSLEIYAKSGPSYLLQDSMGIPALVTPTRSGDDEQVERVHVAVPVLNSESPDELGKDFMQIVVAPDTQKGPVFLRTHRGLQVMPLAEASTMGYTHGYGGTGPSNLAEAIGGFLDWVTGGKFTDEGRQRLWSIIVSSYQGQELVIERENILGQGSVLQTQG